METIENKVANSSLVTIDLEDFYPKQEIVVLDLCSFLTEDSILKEKEYRKQLAETDWSIYHNKIVLLQISQDAILPQWAFLLCASHLLPHCSYLYQGLLDEFLIAHYQKEISALNVANYQDKPLIVKGCSKKKVPSNAYIFLLQKLQAVAKSLSFGEACSSVPIYKKKK